ncbi:MAG: hypothetical protein Athens071426_501 [Parcubacteria group bacterium Athens0714_26]|nr:MAG: hypothetical protein Athens071426_501 [Parcubacteria group bacterium Athens0714_26]
MPELPEVQTTVNDLSRKIIGRRIIGVWSDWSKALKGFSFDGFKKTVKNKKILSIKRRAKNILIYLSDDFLMLIHQKMTGHLLVGRWEIDGKKIIPLGPKEAVSDPYNRFIHLIFYLDSGEMLALSDARKFAKVLLDKKDKIENLPELKNLGPEPLGKNFTFDKFVKLINSEKRKIKQVLMDPEVIAGIGNIYSDEILWQSRIHPFKPANKLFKRELKKIYLAMQSILFKALKLRGTSISDYRDTAGKKGKYSDVRLVYRREGQPCPRCDGKIVRVKMGGRSAHYCPVCQKL